MQVWQGLAFIFIRGIAQRQINCFAGWGPQVQSLTHSLDSVNFQVGKILLKTLGSYYSSAYMEEDNTLSEPKNESFSLSTLVLLNGRRWKGLSLQHQLWYSAVKRKNSCPASARKRRVFKSLHCSSQFGTSNDLELLVATIQTFSEHTLTELSICPSQKTSIECYCMQL